MATKAAQLAELHAELTAIKAAMTSARPSSASFSVDGLQVANRNMDELRKDRTRIEKSIQRLLRGGRGIVVDMSAGVPGDSGDPYRSGGEVLL